MKRLLLALTVIVLLSGCCTQNRCARRYPPAVVVKDSLQTVIEVRDSISYIAPDSSWLMMYLACDSAGEVMIRQIAGYEAGLHAQIPSVAITHNVLTAQCKVDSVEVFNRLYSRTNYQSSATAQTVIKEVNKLTRWQQFEIRCFRIESLLLLLIIIFTTVKFYIKWQKKKLL